MPFRHLIPVYLIIILLSVSCADSNATRDIDIYCPSPLTDGILVGQTTSCEHQDVKTLAINERGVLTFRLVTQMAIDDLSLEWVPDVKNMATEAIVDIRFMLPWYRAANATWDIRKDKHRQKKWLYEILSKDATLISVDHKQQRNFIKTQDGMIAVDHKDFLNSQKKPIILDADSPQIGSMQAGDTRWLWLTLNPKRQLAPGHYSAMLNLTSQKNNLKKSIPVHFEILPFLLLAPEIEYAIYYTSVLRPDIYTSDYNIKAENVISTELKNMLEHGIQNPTIYDPIDSPEALDTLLNIRSSLGMSNKNVYLLGLNMADYRSSDKVKRNIKLVQQLKEHLAPKGIEALYFYGIDEANAQLIKEQKAFWHALQALGTPIKIFAASWQNPELSGLAGAVDIAVLGAMPKQNVNETFIKKGTRPYLYNQPQSGVIDPIAYRKNYGVKAWQQGFNGVMPFAFQYPMGSPWDDADHAEFRDHMFTYWVDNRLLDTVQWEGLSAGVDDVRYVSTLLWLASQTQDKKLLNEISALKKDSSLDLDKMRTRIKQYVLDFCRQSKGAKKGPCDIAS